MGITPGAKSRIEEKYRTTDQRIQDPDIFIKDFPLEPSGLYLKTNNFVQQGLNRLLAFSASENKWVRVRVDGEGRLAISQDPDELGWVKIQDREAATIKVFDAISLPAYGILTHEGQDVSGYSCISFMASTTGACTIYIQGSDDNVNWYEWKSVADADRTFSCINEKIWADINCCTRYIRLVIYNSTASAVTVTGILNGRV